MADNEQKNDKKESKGKPTGRVGMGAATVVINEGAGV